MATEVGPEGRDDVGPSLSVRQRSIVVYAYIVQGLYLSLGILGLLFSEASISDESGSEFLGVFTIHVGGAMVYLAFGVLGPPMATSAGRARLYLLIVAPTFVLWGLLGLALNGSPTDLFTGQALVVVTHLLTGLIAGGLVLWSDRERR